MAQLASQLKVPSAYRERNVLFNDALNTFYLRLYGIRHMVKDHSDSEKGNPLPPHRLLLSINSKVLLYAPSHRQDNTYYGLCYTSRGALAGTRNSSMGPPHEGSNALPLSYVPLPQCLRDVIKTFTDDTDVQARHDCLCWSWLSPIQMVIKNKLVTNCNKRTLFTWLYMGEENHYILLKKCRGTGNINYYTEHTI